MDYLTITDICASVGFPIAVSIYLLIERDRTTKKLTETITDLRIFLEGRYSKEV